jgi:alpha-glutamyl/putrescinyl thymine pyrophosphorylase clade 1
MSEPVRNIGQIPSPFARVVAWVLLREELRQRKEAGEVWPWTVCPLLSGGSRFTNARREDDATSRWCAANVRAPYAGTPELLPAVVLFILFNLIETGATLFEAIDGEASPFAQGLEAGSVAPLRLALARQSPPYANRAYQIFGLSKTDMPIQDQLLVQWKLWLDGSDWRWRYERWSDSPPLLARTHAWFRTSYRFGDFTAAQFIAVLKHAAPLDQAPDWWAWAAPGPGSKLGLNLALGRDPKAAWDAADWLAKLQAVAKVLTPRLEAAGVPPLHMQDWQNVMCETGKLWRIARGGKAKNSSRPSAERLPASEADLSARMGELREDARRRFALAGVDERYLPDLAAAVTDMRATWRKMKTRANGRL